MLLSGVGGAGWGGGGGSNSLYIEFVKSTLCMHEQIEYLATFTQLALWHSYLFLLPSSSF